MDGGTVGWHFFDPDSGLVPEDASLSSLPNHGRGRIVVLAATPFAVSSGWGARAAVTLAKEWAEEGLKIFLMDLGLETPTVHVALGLPNGEGVSDAFLYGASVQHIARPVKGESYFFAPAGSRPGDPEEVLGHHRWNDLAGGFSEADATLVLFLPTDIPGAGKILSRSTDILFLSSKAESADAHLGPASIKVMASLGPFGAPPVEEPTSPSEDQEPEAPEVEAEAPEKETVQVSSDPDEFGSGLSLAEGFGLEAPTEEEPAEEAAVEGDTLPGADFDFSGDLELAEGFEDLAGFDVDGEEPDLEEEHSPGSIPGPEGATDMEGAPSLIGDGPGSGFGDDFQMGASLAGDLDLDAEEGDGEEEGTSEAPVFEADFVDLGSPEEPGGESDEFGGDLVQGPDFGGAPSSEDSSFVEMPETLPEEAPSPEEAAEADLGEEVRREAPKRRRPPKKPFPFAMVGAVILALGVVGAVAGTAMGYFDIPGLGFLQNPFGDVPDPPLTLAGPQPNEEILRFSLVLFTYDEEDLEDATDMLEALRSRLPDLLFVLVPGEIDREPVYTLLAGPAVDRIEAEDLRGPLAEVLSREDPESWVIRETPRAFYLGERGTLEEAREYVATLGVEGVYPYILHVTYPDNAEAFEILSGAFETVMDARPLQLILRSGGFIDVPLIERRGRLPE